MGHLARPVEMGKVTPAFLVTASIAFLSLPWDSAPKKRTLSLCFTESAWSLGRLAMQGGQWTPQASMTTPLPLASASEPLPTIDLPSLKSDSVGSLAAGFLSAA